MTARRLLVILATLTLAATRSAVAQSIPVTVGGQASSLPGVPFELPIQADLSGRTDKLGSFSVVLRWNPAVLKFTGGHSGTFGEIQTNEDSLPFGVFRLSGANPAGVSGNVTLGVGVMLPLTSDTTTLKVRVLELYASQSFVDLSGAVVASDRAYCNARGRWGDVDGDGASNSRDALVALTGAVGGPTSPYDVGLADVDGNGATEARDALIMLSAAVGLDVRGFRVMHIAPGPCATGALPHLVLDPGSDTMAVGQSISYAAHLRDVAGNDVSAPDVFWHTNNDQVASVTPAGLVIASQPGTAKITAHQSGGDTASVLVTVVASRHTHWVDALSYNRSNHTGSSQLPYATIGDALQKAQPGDTVRIRPGRYPESLLLGQSVILHGETAGGAGVVIAAEDSTATAIFAIGSRVQVRNLSLDGWATGILTGTMDSLVVDSVRIAGSPSSGCDQTGAILLQDVSFFALRHSRLVGAAASQSCEGPVDYGVLVLGSAGRIVVDSSVITDFGQEGLSADGVDSVLVLRSDISNNGGYAINVCCGAGSGVGLDIEDSRFAGNRYTDIRGYDLRSARIVRTFIDARNIGEAIYLNAHDNTATLALSSDSILFSPGATNDAPPAPAPGVARAATYCCGATWLSASGFNEVVIDRMRVVNGLDGSFYNIGLLTVTNSSLTNLGQYGTAFDVWSDGYSPRTLVAFDSVYVAGALTSCSQCTDGLVASNAGVTANRYRAANLDRALEGDSSMVVTNSVFDDTHTGIDTYGSFSPRVRLEVRNTTMTGVCNGIQSEDRILAIDNVHFVGKDKFCGEGISTYGGGADTVTNSTIEGFDYAIDFADSTAYVANNTLLNPGTDAISAGFLGAAEGDTLVISQNQISCDAYGAQNAGGIDLSSGNVKVDGNTVGGCEWNIYLYGQDATTRGAFVTNNVVSVPLVSDYAGIHYQYYHGDITGNSVTGGASYGGIGVFASGALRPGSVRVLSNTVRQAQTWAIRSDYVDSILVRGNLIEDYSNPYCCQNRAGAISVGEAQNRISVQGNTLRRIHGVGITVDQLDNYRETTDTATAVIDSNAVSGADTAAVLMQSGTFVMHSNNIRDNALYGVRAVGYPQHDADSLHGNAFKGNGLYAVSADFDGTIRASGNWWGVDGAFPHDPGADSTSGSVDEPSPLAGVPTDIPSLAPRMLASASARPSIRAMASRSASVVRPATARVSRTTAVRPHARSAPSLAARPVPSRLLSGRSAAAAVGRAQFQRDEQRAAVSLRLLADRVHALAVSDSAQAARHLALAARRVHRTGHTPPAGGGSTR